MFREGSVSCGPGPRSVLVQRVRAPQPEFLQLLALLSGAGGQFLEGGAGESRIGDGDQ